VLLVVRALLLLWSFFLPLQDVRSDGSVGWPWTSMALTRWNSCVRGIRSFISDVTVGLVCVIRPLTFKKSQIQI
jgi:hypothetical protein